MKVGILGGTFNPPHMGHINAALSAKKAIGLDKIIFIPAGIPPHKQIPENTATDSERFEMTRLAAETAGAEVSDIEMKRKGKSFTADTVSAISKAHPEYELWLIMGTDMFLSFDTWKSPKEIAMMSKIAVVPRNSGDIPALKEKGVYLRKTLGVEYMIIDTEAVEISSTEIRTLRGMNGYLPKSVFEYIENNGLYKKSRER